MILKLLIASLLLKLVMLLVYRIQIVCKAQFTHSITHRLQSQGHPQQVQFQPPQQSQGQDSQQFGTQNRLAGNRDSLIIKSEMEKSRKPFVDDINDEEEESLQE